MNGSGLVCLKRHPPGYQATSRGYFSLTKHGALLGGPSFPATRGTKMENMDLKSEKKESSAVWASSKGSCTEAPEGATAQVPDEQRTDETPLIGGGGKSTT